MSTRLGTAVLGVLGGLLLLAGGGLAFLAGEQSEVHRLAGVGGYAVGLAALALVGYALVDHAPVWLRLVVCAGLPLLAFSVWQVVEEEIGNRVTGWKADAWPHLAAGIVLLLIGVLAARGATDPADRYQPSHR